jgi:hypothetical protein
VTRGVGDDVRFECILGRCDTMRGEVYVRVCLPPGAAGGSLQGTLTGPECSRASTLPVTARLRPLPGPSPEVGAAATVVTRVILTEPACWTPELPNRYLLEATLSIAGQTTSTCRQMIGLRQLGVRGRSLWLDGRRFVPRGLARPGCPVDREGFRAADLTAVVSTPDEAFLDHCDAEGLAVIALLASASGQPPAAEEAGQQIALWAGHPSVFVAVIPAGLHTNQVAAVAANTRATRGTLLVAAAVDGSRPPEPLPAGIDAVVLNLPAAGLPHAAWRTTTPPLPVIACRSQPASDDEPTRRPCDNLQAALAAWATAEGHRLEWDWAGYLVVPSGLD